MSGRRRLGLLLLLGILGGGGSASAQTSTVIKAVDPATGLTTDVGDSTGQALHVTGPANTVTTGTLSSTTCPGTGCVELPTLASTTGSLVVEWIPSSWNFSNTVLVEGGATSTTVTAVTCTGNTLGVLASVIQCPGYPYMRVRVTNYVSGTSAVRLVSTIVPYAYATVTLAGGSSVGIVGSVSVNQGLSGSSTFPWWTQIGDATNGPVAVKAASTAAVAADPALVTRTVQLPAALAASGGLKVDGSAVAQPVQGINLDGVTGVTPLSPVTVGGHYLAVQPSYSDDAVTSFASTQRGALVVAPGVEGFPISAAALPLPTGASTSALQTTGNTSLSSIDTKTPALGQALAAASVPVILPAATITTLTPPAAITGFALAATQTNGNQKTQITDGSASTGAYVSDRAGFGVQPLNGAVGMYVYGELTRAIPAGAATIGRVIADAGTNLNTSLLALEAGGNLAQVVVNTRQRGSTAAPVMIQATDMDTTLLAANTSRVSWQVCNQSGSIMLLKFGSGASPFSYNVRVPSGACYSDTAYMGVVNGAWYVGADRYAIVSETF